MLDLGGGPGQFSLAFAERGASVTWHDPSRRYRAIAQQWAREHGVQCEWSLGYLEQATRFLNRPFDVVFNRICWSYCLDDRAFERLLFDLVCPGGSGYIDTNTIGLQLRKPEFFHCGSFRGRLRRRVCWKLYLRFGWKVDCCYVPPRDRLAQLFTAVPVELVQLDYSGPLNDHCLFRRPPLVPANLTQAAVPVAA